MPVSLLVKMKNFFGQHLQADYSIVSISMSSDHRDGRTMKFFFHLNNQTYRSIVGSTEAWGWQTRLYFWRYWVVACLKLSHFNSQVNMLDFTWNCCRLQEAKNFLTNSGRFECATRETIYHVSIAEILIRNL